MSRQDESLPIFLGTWTNCLFEWPQNHAEVACHTDEVMGGGTAAVIVSTAASQFFNLPAMLLLFLNPFL